MTSSLSLLCVCVARATADRTWFALVARNIQATRAGSMSLAGVLGAPGTIRAGLTSGQMARLAPDGRLATTDTGENAK